MDIPTAKAAYDGGRERQYQTHLKVLCEAIELGLNTSVLYALHGVSSETKRYVRARLEAELIPLGYAITVEEQTDGHERIRVSWHPDDTKEVSNAEAVP